jgi:hypothetical protein
MGRCEEGETVSQETCLYRYSRWPSRGGLTVFLFLQELQVPSS